MENNIKDTKQASGASGQRAAELMDGVLSGCGYHSPFSLDESLEELGAWKRLEKEAVLARLRELGCISEDSTMASARLSPKGKAVKFAGSYSDYIEILESERLYINSQATDGKRSDAT